VSLLEVLRGKRFVLAVKEGLLPLLHQVLHLLHVVLHFLDEVVNFLDDAHASVDELVDSLRVPSEGVNTWLEGLVNLIDTVLEEGLLNIQEGRKDLVVHVDNEVEVSSLATINVDFLEEDGSSLGYIDVKELEILDLTKESNEDWVEVDSEEALGGDGSLLAD
jgi:hypothetical protein